MITLATLPQATAQEVFDQGAIHMLTQNEQCKNEGGYWYRLGNLKCVGGCFISDEEYTTDFDDQMAATGSWECLYRRGLVPFEHSALISSLQRVHDGWPVVLWKEKLLAVATVHNLSTSAIDNFKK